MLEYPLYISFLLFHNSGSAAYHCKYFLDNLLPHPYRQPVRKKTKLPEHESNLYNLIKYQINESFLLYLSK